MDKIVQDQFLQPVKVHPCDKFGYVGKIMPRFFSSKTILKYAELDVFGLLITQLFLYHF